MSEPTTRAKQDETKGTGRRLKVWGGTSFVFSPLLERLGLPPQTHNQYRTIVAATTKKRARELVRASVTEFRDYWCETGNEVELSIATQEGVWFAPLDGVRGRDSYRTEQSR